LWQIFAGALLICLTCPAIGCSPFQLQPYSDLVLASADRTVALSADRPIDRPLNRAARLPGRSQAQIKTRLESLWRPSLLPTAWVNYSGLIATRYSLLNLAPGPIFQPGELIVRHMGRRTSVQYISAWHPGRKLPLIVAVSGINGTVDGRITIEILENLFNSGNFHIVHLESVSSVNHQVRNQQPFLGGFPEGVLLYQSVAALRSQPELADQISQVHLLGVSYGGLLCGIASHCEDQFQRGVIDGAVLAYSPPLDLKVLFDNLAANTLIGNQIYQSYIGEAVQRLLQHMDVGVPHHELHQLSFDSFLHRVAFPQFQKVRPQLAAEFPSLPPVETPDDLYAISSVQPHFDSLGVPFLFVLAYDDPVVSPEDHFRKVLAECSNQLVDGILLEDGGHLGFDLVTRSPFTSRLTEEYFRYWSASPTRQANR